MYERYASKNSPPYAVQIEAKAALNRARSIAPEFNALR